MLYVWLNFDIHPHLKIFVEKCTELLFLCVEILRFLSNSHLHAFLTITPTSMLKMQCVCRKTGPKSHPRSDFLLFWLFSFYKCLPALNHYYLIWRWLTFLSQVVPQFLCYIRCSCEHYFRPLPLTYKYNEFKSLNGPTLASLIL